MSDSHSTCYPQLLSEKFPLQLIKSLQHVKAAGLITVTDLQASVPCDTFTQTSVYAFPSQTRQNIVCHTPFHNFLFLKNAFFKSSFFNT